jgi:AcrR family transcriptional regulator
MEAQMADEISERLVVAAERLLRSGRTAESLTTREIAVEAGASVGLINYHFASKDALIAAAADRIFQGFAPRWDRIADAASRARDRASESASVEGYPERAALEAGKAELSALLKDMADVVEATKANSEFMVRRELLEGDLVSSRTLSSALRSFLPKDTDERTVRWAAFFVTAPLQLLFLRRKALEDWTGTDLEDRAERDAVFDFLIDAILGAVAAKAGPAST